MDSEPDLTLEDIRAELSDLGRALLDQAFASARRAKQLRAELARVANGQPPAGEGGTGA